ncbi:hypothetical protein Dda_3346 [Drechslerella dactyloides]|uniref:Uncharacterized protein n=1 Tax=Drechslerella dactyloides TaxID=74499 RepID=A0AAD6J1F1_DREDA|nr:hypothetical protein Dda_3346 [Drechslerella dactyloides]
MPPKKGKNKKRNSIAVTAKENGDADPLNSPAPGTPAEEKDQEFVTPADRPDNPLDAPTANGAASTPAETADEKTKEGATNAMAKAEGDEEVAAWGLDGDKGKGFTEEPDLLPDTVEKLDNGVEEIPTKEPRAPEPEAEPTEAESKPVDAAIETAAEVEAEVKDEAPTANPDEPAPIETEKAAPPVDLDIPDTADTREPIEHITEKPPVEEPVGDVTEKQPVEELTDEKPTVEEPVEEKAVVDEPVAEKPAEEAPAPDEPAPEESAPAEPAVQEPSAEEAAQEVVADAEAAAAAVAEAEAEAAPKAEEPEPMTEPTNAAEPEPEPTATESAAAAAAEGEPASEPAPAEPAFPGRPIMEAPKPTTLDSLTSSNRDFTSTRYQSTTSPQFLNKPHQPANHSLDLDDRNMQSSVNNWYKKIFSFADNLKWRPGWEYLEEFEFLVKALEAPLSQISLAPAQEWWAEKPKDPTIEWDKIDEHTAKYEEFWEWKSKVALTAILANFACREVLGKTVFGLDAKATRKLGHAMSVFSKDFGDDITATKFRHMALKMLQESRAFQSNSRKQLVQLSQELANVLSPLTSFMDVPTPRTEEEKLQQAHYTPLTLALYEKVLAASITLHDTIQKDHKYYALFHPVPGVEFDEMTMEESTFEGIGAGKGAVALVARPGLARLGLPRGGESEDIVIVHKALVVRDGALEDATSHFDDGTPQPPPAE